MSVYVCYTGDKRQSRKDSRNLTRRMNEQIAIKKMSQIKEILSLFSVKSVLLFYPHNSLVMEV